MDPDRLADWCLENLGSRPTEVLFTEGHESSVSGLRLEDGSEVVVKVRRASPRIAACVQVQQHMFESGYPCPKPLTGPIPFGSEVATAEVYVPGGDLLPSPEVAHLAFAEAFARLLRLAPPPEAVPLLRPAPPWAAWDHDGPGLWPLREGSEIDLNEAPGADWIDYVGRCSRDRLSIGEAPVVIGHCDWLADNLRWSGDSLLVVHDWDSVVADSEAVLVGFAAALYPGGRAGELASIEDTERFLGGYVEASGREFSRDELERSWAAGLWTRAYDAKFQHAIGAPVTSLSETEALWRLARIEAAPETS